MFFGEKPQKYQFILSIFFQKLKLKYYNLMIQLDQHEGSYLSICKHYRAIYDTPCIQAESEKWQQVRIYILSLDIDVYLEQFAFFLFEIIWTSVICAILWCCFVFSVLIIQFILIQTNCDNTANYHIGRNVGLLFKIAGHLTKVTDKDLTLLWKIILQKLF